jgi:hypothetical protein
LATDFWNHLQYRLLLSQPTGRSHFMALISYGGTFKSFYYHWAGDLISELQLKLRIVLISFCPAMTPSFETFPLFPITLFVRQSSSDIFVYKTSGSIYPKTRTYPKHWI